MITGVIMKFTNRVSYCKIEFYGIGEIDFSKDINLPFSYEVALDETLDTAKIRLSNLRRGDYPKVDISKAFEPNSRVRIGFEGQQTEIVMRIAHDDTKMQRKDETPWRSWTHVILLVEETKQTERESVDTLTFANPIERKYDAQADADWSPDEEKRYYNSGSAEIEIGTYSRRDWQPPTIKMLYTNGNIAISDNASSFNHSESVSKDYVINRLTLTVTSASYQEQVYSSTLQLNGDPPSGALAKDERKYKNTTFNLALTDGEYKLTFEIICDEDSNDGSAVIHNRGKYTTYIAVGTKENLVSNYTMADVINRLLSVTPLRTKESTNKYKFDAAQLAEFAKEEAPEFAFTGHTLFEALMLIAGYKGSFPVLKGDTISFRPLWNGKNMTNSGLPPANEEVNSSDLNQYCTYLESEVQNIVGINDSRTGTLTEPYAGGYKTTRSGSGSEISEDTAIIPTGHNMYQHISLNMGYTNGTTVGDITPYVYEEGEYNGLSDTSGAYPNSKAYALKWAQMGRNYTEITHRITRVNSVESAFERPAISNILYARTGDKSNSSLMTYLKNLLGIKGDDSSHDTFADLMFRAEYIPIFNARIKQYKDYFGDFHYSGSIKYNQSAELVDSEMYGEHLKQLIRKIGNATKRAVYTFEKIDDIPEVGTVIDGYSVYDVAMTIYENKVIATISFVKYAELSRYIGVKNPWKDSDVSIDKCYNRAVSYNEFLLFTHDGEKRSTSKTLSDKALNQLTSFTEATPLTCIEATGYAKNGDALNTVLLPVISLAVGNSLFFQWEYEDNYSAGNMSESAPKGSTNALSGTAYHRAQKAVKYCDMYGRLETYSFAIMPTGPIPNECGWSEDGIHFVTDAATVAKNIGNALPLRSKNIYKAVQISDGWGGNYSDYYEWEGEKYISVSNLLIQKNSSEALTFSVQLHYCTDNENFIVGSGLTNFCSLIGGAAEEVGLYGFYERINIFSRRLSVANAAKLTSAAISVNKDKHRIEITLPASVNGYNAWALLGKDKNGNHQVIFGENRNLHGDNFNTDLFIVPLLKEEDIAI